MIFDIENIDSDNIQRYDEQYYGYFNGLCPDLNLDNKKVVNEIIKDHDQTRRVRNFFHHDRCHQSDMTKVFWGSLSTYNSG